MNAKKESPAAKAKRGCAFLSGRTNIIVFKRRLRHPVALSQIVAEYRATHYPKGNYKTPLPEDRRTA